MSFCCTLVFLTSLQTVFLCGFDEIWYNLVHVSPYDYGKLSNDLVDKLLDEATCLPDLTWHTH